MWKAFGADLRGRGAILSVLAAFVLSACGTVAPVFKLNESLGANEGGVLLMIHSEFNNVEYKIKEIGFGKVFVTSPFDAGAQFRMLKLPAGDYEFGSVGVGNKLFIIENAKFTVKPGVMNYPGDVFISRAFYRDGTLDYTHVRLQFVDKQDRLEALLAEHYPSLQRRFRLEVRTAGKK
jgi:hypothetical protein